MVFSVIDLQKRLSDFFNTLIINVMKIIPKEITLEHYSDGNYRHSDFAIFNVIDHDVAEIYCYLEITQSIRVDGDGYSEEQTIDIIHEQIELTIIDGYDKNGDFIEIPDTKSFSREIKKQIMLIRNE